MAEGSFFRRHQSMRALAHRDFRLLLAGSAIVSFVMPVQFLTQVFWVEDHYAARQVLYVGLLGVSRGAAMLLFSLFGGAIADRFERRRVLLFCESTALGLNTLVALLMLTHPFGEATMIALLCLTFAAAGNMAIDMPARTASTPAIVGMEDLANGISLQMIAQQLATPLSLPLVGLLNSVFDSGQVYAGTLVCLGRDPSAHFDASLPKRGRGQPRRRRPRQHPRRPGIHPTRRHHLRRHRHRLRDPGRRHAGPGRAGPCLDDRRDGPE